MTARSLVTSGALAIALCGGGPLNVMAQSPSAAAGARPDVSIRPFVFGAIERFSAGQTFGAVFGSAVGAFWGGGGDVSFRRGFFLDVSVSHFHRSDGQRVFRANGQTFPLGIPVAVSLTPFEVSAGYRRVRPRSRVIPYLGGGVGSYAYEESAPDGSDAFTSRHAGVLAVGGVEVRLRRWVGVSADVQYTHVGGILGESGVSQAFGENNLGGVSTRFRLLVGK